MRTKHAAMLTAHPPDPGDDHCAVHVDPTGKWRAWKRVYGQWMETPTLGTAVAAIDVAANVASKMDVTIFGRPINAADLDAAIAEAVIQPDHCRVLAPLTPGGELWGLLRYGPFESVTLCSTLRKDDVGKFLSVPAAWGLADGRPSEVQMVRREWSIFDLVGDEQDLAGIGTPSTLLPVAVDAVTSEVARVKRASASMVGAAA